MGGTYHVTEERGASGADLADVSCAGGGVAICKFLSIFRGDSVNREEEVCRPHFTPKETELQRGW